MTLSSPLLLLGLVFAFLSAPAIANTNLLSLNPPYIQAGGPDVTLSIGGSGLMQGGAVILGATSLATTYIDSTKITAILPASISALSGPYQLYVRNPDGSTSNTLYFEVQPALTGITPNSAPAGSPTTPVTVTGIGFVPGVSLKFVTASSPAPISSVYISSTTMTAFIDASLLTTPGAATIQVASTGYLSAASLPFTITSSAPGRAALTSLVPASTSAGAGAAIQVNGSGFANGCTAQWNGTPLSTIVINAAQLSVQIPATLTAALGTASITVVNPGAAASNPLTFTVTAAQIAAMGGVSPASATAGGPAFVLTVNGGWIVSGAVVQWNGTPLATTYVSSTQLTAQVPAPLIANRGSANVTIVNPGASPSSPAAFTIWAASPPVLSSLSQSSTVAGGAALTLTVSGSNFISGATVQWNGAPLPTVFVSPTQLNAQVSASLLLTPGTVPITVAEPALPVSNALNFTISPAAAATLAALSPSSTTAGSAGFTLTATGAGFVTGSAMQWNGVPVPTTFVSSTQLTAQVAAGLIATAGSASITVVNPGASATAGMTFLVTAAGPPAQPTLNPGYALQGGPAFTITVSGAGFASGAAVLWSGAPLSTTFINSTQLTAQVPASLLKAPRWIYVSVLNPGTTASRATPFEVMATSAAVISTLLPNAAVAGGPGFKLTINGSNFAPGALVQWNGSVINSVILNPNQIVADVSANLLAAPGPASITITTPSLPASNALTLTVSSTPIGATVSGLYPPSVVAGSPLFQLGIAGTGFLPTSTIQWNGAALDTQFLSATALAANVPASLVGQAGVATITVVTPGAPTVSVQYTIADTGPVLSSLSPASGFTGGPAFTLTVNGSGFVYGASVTWISQPLQTTYISPTQLTANVTPDLLGLPGNISIGVVENDFPASNYLQLNMSAPAGTPSVNGLSPQVAIAGGPDFALTVRGVNFQPGAVVQWNGASVPTTFVSGGQLTATVPASLIADPSVADITVVNPSGATSVAALYNVYGANPIITSITPATAQAGAPGFTLTVNGSGLAPNAFVEWNGSPVGTYFVSTSQLTAKVGGANLASPGTIQVSVLNPGGYASNSLPFAVTASIPPAIGGVVPSPIIAGGGPITISVTGANLVNGSAVYWGSTALVTGFTGTPGTATVPVILTATVPANLTAICGSFPLTVHNPDGSVSNAWPIYVSPSLTSISPANISAQSAPFTLTATGVGFGPNSYISINGVAAPTSYVSSTTLTTTVTAAMLGLNPTVPVTVRDPSGVSSETRTLVTTAPLVSSWAPAGVAAGSQAFTLTINGAGFIAGTSITWNGSSLPAPTIVSPGQMTVPISAARVANAGTAAVSITNSNGTATFSFPVTPAGGPSISSVSPNQLSATQAGVQLHVTGTGYAQNATVNWAGTPLNSFEAPGGTLNATVPASLVALSGRFDITVANPDGSVSPPYAIFVEPVLSGVNLGRDTGGSPLITAVGAGFVPSDVIQVSIGGATTNLTTSYLSSTALTAPAPAAFLTSAGTVPVTVADPLTGTISAVANILPMQVSPAIASVSPPAVASGSADFTLVVNGANFDSGTQLLWNGSPVNSSFISSSQIAAVIPATLVVSPGTVSLTVRNAAALVSNALPFSVTAAVPITSGAGIVNAGSGVQSIAPGSLISIYGSNLAGTTAVASTLPLPVSLAGATVTIDGIQAPLLFVSPGQINAQVPMEVPIGTAQLTVQTPLGTSGIAQFPVSLTGPGVMILSGNHVLAVDLSTGAINSAQNPAAPGDFVMIYVTGQGQVSPPIPTGAAAPSDPLSYPAADVEVSIGGQPATLQFAGMAPGLAGLMQVNILVPNVAPGDQSLSVKVGGATANATVIAIGN